MPLGLAILAVGAIGCVLPPNTVLYISFLSGIVLQVLFLQSLVTGGCVLPLVGPVEDSEALLSPIERKSVTESTRVFAVFCVL